MDLVDLSACLIGTHALHAIAGIIALLCATLVSRPRESRLQVCAMYWYFVVAVWPVLYGLVYF